MRSAGNTLVPSCLFLVLAVCTLSYCGSTGMAHGPSPSAKSEQTNYASLPMQDLVSLAATGSATNPELTATLRKEVVAELGDRDRPDAEVRALIRMVAIETLKKQDAGKAVACLLAIIQDERIDRRYYILAVGGLGTMGPTARAAVPTLIDELPKARRKGIVFSDGKKVFAGVGSALQRITGQDLGDDEALWRSWLKNNATAAPTEKCQ